MTIIRTLLSVPVRLNFGCGSSLIPISAGIHISAINERARKGTRARKAKGKVKIEEKIRPFLQRLEEQKRKVFMDQRPMDKSHYGKPVDDVFFYRRFEPKQWSFQEALQNHREIHHPTVYNMPNSPLMLRIDMDFRYPNRPQKCMDGWRSTVEMKAPFLMQGMTIPKILSILPNDETEIAATLAAGADVAGSVDIIKQIQHGQIRGSDFEYIVCHPFVLPEITPIRGLIKKNFPSFKTGTISVDVPDAVKRLRNGLKLTVTSSDQQPDYAYIDTPIGTLNMDSAGLEQNFESILADTLGRRVVGKVANEFIIQCLLKTPNSSEAFKINIQDVIRRCDLKRQGAKDKTEEREGADVEKESESTEKAEAVPG